MDITSAKQLIDPRRDTVLIALFILFLLAPTLAALLGWDPTPPINEKRVLRPLPTWDAQTWTQFPERFENYYNDHFGLRNTLIRWHSIVKVALLGVSSDLSVVVGRGKWLFSSADVEAYRSAQSLTPTQLASWRTGLEDRQREAEKLGARFVVVVAPSPASIYPEALPWSHLREPHLTWLDQFQQYMRSNSTVEIFDLRPSLLAGKSAGLLYQRTDTHWNDLGAYFAYASFIGHLTRSWPQMPPPWALAQFEQRTVRQPGGDLATSLALSDLRPEYLVQLRPRIPRRAMLGEQLLAPSGQPVHFRMSTDSTGPRALMIHDSFTYVGWYPFLAEHFAEIKFVWRQETTVVPSPVFLSHFPGAELVILEMVERTLSDR